jgi:hypothetical protein
MVQRAFCFHDKIAALDQVFFRIISTGPERKEWPTQLCPRENSMDFIIHKTYKERNRINTI